MLLKSKSSISWSWPILWPWLICFSLLILQLGRRVLVFDDHRWVLYDHGLVWKRLWPVLVWILFVCANAISSQILISSYLHVCNVCVLTVLSFWARSPLLPQSASRAFTRICPVFTLGVLPHLMLFRVGSRLFGDQFDLRRLSNIHKAGVACIVLGFSLYNVAIGRILLCKFCRSHYSLVAPTTLSEVRVGAPCDWILAGLESRSVVVVLDLEHAWGEDKTSCFTDVRYLRRPSPTSLQTWSIHFKVLII